MKKIFTRDEHHEDEAAEETVAVPAEVVHLTTVLVREVDLVQNRLDELHTKFDARLREDEGQHQLFNQLYDDMQARRREQLDDHLLPLVRSILLVIDRIDGRQAGAADGGEDLVTLREELLDALYAVGVEPIEVPPGTRDNRLQRVVETVTTGEQAWVERKPGYVLGTRVIRPQQIAVREDVAVEESA